MDYEDITNRVTIEYLEAKGLDQDHFDNLAIYDQAKIAVIVNKLAEEKLGIKL